MTTEPVKTNKMYTSLALKSFKILKSFLIPILGSVALICGILSLFKTSEGSNSRFICVVIFLVSLVFVLLIKYLDGLLSKNNYFYAIYSPVFLKKLQPEVIIPLCLLLIVIALPFYILVLTSFKTPLEANNLEFSWWFKDGISFESYREVLSFNFSSSVSMWIVILNSFVYSILPTAVGLFTSSISAYAFSKLEFRGRNLVYYILIMTIMMPSCVTMTTAYMMYDWYGWTNSALPLIVPGFFGGAATVMFLREYFMGIPDGLLEAARIDGAGKWKSFFLIVLPLGKPALMAQFILNFIGRYNDFISPLIYLNDPNKYTVQVAMNFLGYGTTDKSLIAAAGAISLAPMLLLYIVFQKRILNGIAMTSGLKG